MKILITGATGSIGSKLSRKLIDRSDSVAILSRDPQSARLKIAGASEYLQWNYNNPETWKVSLNNKDAIIHLASTNLGSRRWNKEFKKQVYESRIISTKNIVEAIQSLEKKPRVFICASAVGYYGNRGDDLLVESELPGKNFLSDICSDWEQEASEIEKFSVRRVSIRTGLVLNTGEGLLKKLYLPFKLFLGGPLGNGKQWFPWIHIDDIVSAFIYAMDSEEIEGPLNAASPGIVRMKDFAKTFGGVLNRPSYFPVPDFILRIAAGELGKYATHSQNVSVEKLLKSGYKFKFNNLEDALKDLLSK